MPVYYFPASFLLVPFYCYVISISRFPVFIWLLVVAIFGNTVISSLWFLQPGSVNTLWAELGKLGAGLIFFMYFFQVYRRGEDALQAIAIPRVGIFLISVTLLLYLFGLGNIFGTSGRFSGFMPEPFWHAAVAGFLTLQRSMRGRWIYHLIVASSVVLAGSLTGLLFYGVALMFYGLSGEASRVSRAMLLFGVLLAALAFLVLVVDANTYLGRNWSMLSNKGIAATLNEHGSAYIRFFYPYYASLAILDFPLGVGTANYGQHANLIIEDVGMLPSQLAFVESAEDYARVDVDPRSFWAALGLNVGIIILVVLASKLILGVRSLWANGGQDTALLIIYMCVTGLQFGSLANILYWSALGAAFGFVEFRRRHS